jgi:hypothetical protein
MRGSESNAGPADGRPLTELQNLQGADFEAAWLTDVAAHHDRMLQVIDFQLQDATTSTAVRDYLERCRKVAARQKAITSSVVTLVDGSR